MEKEVQRILAYYDKVHHYLNTDPETAISIARKTAEAICCEIFYAKKKKNSKKMMLNDLIQSLSRDDLLPPHVAVSLGTIQAFGNFGTHYQLGAGECITVEYVQPCVHALTTVVNWFVEDVCGSTIKDSKLEVVPQPQKAKKIIKVGSEECPSDIQREVIKVRADVEIHFSYVLGSLFKMGSPDSEVGRKSDEPMHSVEANNFFISETTITEKQYVSVIGRNPGHFLGDNYPVSNVTWEDAIKFCEKLSLISGKIIDLPSEAEWEYSCRAKQISAYSFGDTFDSNKVNCDSRSAGGCFVGKSMPVKSYASNEFGLFEMHGNIFEWCKDNYSRRFYKLESKGNPVCLDGSKKVVRGGSFECEPKGCRSASRSSFAKTYKASNVGFRVVIRDGQNVK